MTVLKRASRLALVSVLLSASLAFAQTQAASTAADPALELRVQRISAELRCLVCQNQTIADSNADLANDLRRQVREMLQKGSSDRDVINYMTARYGDFVLYRPPVKTTTALLWAGPALLLVGGALALVLILRRRSRLPDAAFDRDEDDGKATGSDTVNTAASDRT